MVSAVMRITPSGFFRSCVTMARTSSRARFSRSLRRARSTACAQWRASTSRNCFSMGEKSRTWSKVKAMAPMQRASAHRGRAATASSGRSSSMCG